MEIGDKKRAIRMLLSSGNPAAVGAFLTGDLENAAIAATPGGIEAQEAAGQQHMVASQILPKDGPWAELEALGVKRIGSYDDLFDRCELPKGSHGPQHVEQVTGCGR